MNMKALFTKVTLLSALLVMFTATSCEKIFDYEGDCSIHCQIKFKYDMNMKFADAFPNTVKHVTVYVYDVKDGKLLLKQSESGDVLSRENYTMELEGLKPGTYDVIAWCGNGLKDGHFDVPATTVGSSVMTDLTCTMDREQGGLVKKDVGQLYHGKVRVNFPDEYGTHVETVSLIKNTNNVKVVLQHLSGIDVNPDDFRYEIQDENGLMAHDNALLEDEVLTYSPWSVQAGSADINADIYSKAQTSVSVALAEFTVGRLVMENNPVLSIYNVKENEKVLSIPLKDYALLVKGNYNVAMSDQEYLDRQDEYNLTFFLDEHGLWSTSRIIINSWHLVLQNSDLN
jgi:hypothetical protein